MLCCLSTASLSVARALVSLAAVCGILAGAWEHVLLRHSEGDISNRNMKGAKDLFEELHLAEGRTELLEATYNPRFQKLSNRHASNPILHARKQDSLNILKNLLLGFNTVAALRLPGQGVATLQHQPLYTMEDTSDVIPQKRRRLLCLPGKGGTGAKFKRRLHSLQEIADIVCIDGTHAFGNGFVWWNLPVGERSFTSPVFEGWDESVERLRKVWAEQGPFDGILGFSQGAIFIAALCALGIVVPSTNTTASKKTSTTPVIQPDFLMLFGSHVPGPFKSELAELAEKRPNFRALHIIGDQDETNPPEGGKEVAKAVGGSIFLHPGGHILPMDERAVATYAQFLSQRTENS